MAHDVIMPALGMAQDTGRIVAWHKQEGDPVEKGDVLLEIETDKATMEVEAAASGILGAIYGKEGEDIPVGDTIAIITASGEDMPAPSHPSSPASDPVEVSQPDRATAAMPTQSAPVAPPASESRRILASPKARSLARARDIALEDVVASGVDQPIHAGDIDAYQPSPPQPVATAFEGGTMARDRIVARISSERFDTMRAQIASRSAETPPPGVIWASFAAGALRPFAGDGAIVVEVQSPDPSTARQLSDPDRGGFSRIGDLAEHVQPAFVIRDLSQSRILEMQLARDTAPVISIRRDQDDFVVSLECSAGALETDAAIALVNGLLDRLDNPLRHLL